ncbi:MAG: hypothetical protein MJA29_13600 [Candidatus Omnitrophica bacterium]|nr:hypothetical protein [Candidatus Omnitrophota bacterium]
MDTVTEPHKTSVMYRSQYVSEACFPSQWCGRTSAMQRAWAVAGRQKPPQTYGGAGLGMKVRFLPEATDSNMAGAK